MHGKPQGYSAWYRRSTGIAKSFLVLLIAGLALNTGIQIWSLVTLPAASVVLSGTTAVAAWQFVDEFPPQLTDELHFILTDSGVRSDTPSGHQELLSPLSSRSYPGIDALGGAIKSLVDINAVSLRSRLARFDRAGKLLAFGAGTPLTFRELVGQVKLSCSDVISDDVERTVSFNSKNGTRWECLFIEGDSDDSFLVCETVEHIPDPHQPESDVR